MGFWVFMLIMDLLIPLTMIILGKSFVKRPPKEINQFYGYRTPMSIKNMDTWRFANHYCGKIWYICGLAMLPLTIFPMFFVIGESNDSIGTAVGIICTIQAVLLVGSIFPTELALRKRFDKNGFER